MLRTCGVGHPWSRALVTVHATVWRDGHDFVRVVSTSTIVLERGSEELLRWVLLRLSDGRQLLLVERTYRDGIKVLVQPSEEELQAARRDPWAAWNSERGEHVAGIDDLLGKALGG